MKKRLLSLALTASVFLNSYTFGMDPSVSPTNSRPQTSNALAEVPTFGASEVEYSDWREGGWNINSLDEENYLLFVFMRHARDANNIAGIGHAGNSEADVTIGTIGLYSADIIRTIGRCYFNPVILAPKENRHAATAQFLRTPESTSRITNLLKEQELGNLRGRTEGEIINSDEFKKMLCNPYYRISGQPSESGIDVMRRFDRLMKEEILTDLELATPGIKFLISSCCTLNWIARYFTQNTNLILKIENHDSFALAYFPRTRKVSIFSDDRQTPLILPPQILYFSSLTLKPFMEFNRPGIKEELELMIREAQDRCKSVRHNFDEDEVKKDRPVQQ